MESAHAERDIDVTNASRGVWLVKVPKFLKERWNEGSSNADVGRLKITTTRIAGQKSAKSPAITYSMDSAMAEQYKLPKEHKFITHDIKQSLAVFSLPKGEDGESIAASGTAVSLEGQVIQKFECQPVMDANYLKLKLESKRAAAEPLRKAIPMEKSHMVYKPKANHPHKIAQDRQKETEGKKARQDKEKVLEMLYDAFEKHQYYNIKDLQKITRQPITYLKEILKEICDYNVRMPHKNTWELKREYRHYKSDKPEGGDDSD